MSLPLSKFNFSEGCDKLKDQYNLLFIQFNKLKSESDKLRNEKNNVSRHYGFYYEVSCALNCELHRYLDGLRRISLACSNILPQLNTDQQTQINQIIDFIKQLINNDGYVFPTFNEERSNQNVIQNEGINEPSILNKPVSSDIPPAEENVFHEDLVDTNLNSTENSNPSKKVNSDSSNSQKIIGDNENGIKNQNNIKKDSLQNSSSRHDATHLTNPNSLFIPPPDFSSNSNHFPIYGGEIHQQVVPFPQSMSSNQILSHNRASSSNMQLARMNENLSVPIYNYGVTPVILSQNNSSNSRRIPSHHLNSSIDPIRYNRPWSRVPSNNYTTSSSSFSRYKSYRHSASQKASPIITEFTLPKAFSEVSVLPHGDVVCTVCTTNDRLAITGGKGSVKIWDVSKNTPNTDLVATVDCLNDKYIRSCKTTLDRKVLVAGEASCITLFDLNYAQKSQSSFNSNNIIKLDNNTSACYALAVSPDGRLCYGGCSNGFIIIWDLVSNKIARSYNAHSDGISCLDISPDGTKLYTGSLDRSAKIWDLVSGKVIEQYNYDAQVYSIAAIPTYEWVCAGLENSLIDVSSKSNERFELELHKSSVLSMKVAPTYDWMLSAGKDNIVNCIRTPYGPPIYQIVEEASVLCCDISPDSKWVITGSSLRKATIYELKF